MKDPVTKKVLPDASRGQTLWYLASVGDADGLLNRVNETSEDVDQREPGTTRTPLWIAAAEGHLEATKLLVALGASLTKECEGLSAVDIARKRGQPHVVYYLKLQQDYFPNLKAVVSVPGARRMALLIGNTHYETLEHVPFAKSDVAVVGRRLQAMKFEVFVRTDLSTASMNDHVDQWCQNLRVNDLALFYFAGLGCRQAGRSLLFGVDRKFNLIPEEDRLSVESVVEALLTRTGKKRRREIDLKPDRARRREITAARGPSVVILDACRSVQKTGFREANYNSCSMQSSSAEKGFFDDGITATKALKGHGIGLTAEHAGADLGYSTATSSTRPQLSGRAKALMSQRQHLLTTMNNKPVATGELCNRSLLNSNAVHMRRPYTRKELAFIEQHGAEALARLKAMGGDTTEPFSTTGALKSFPSNCGPQLGAMPVKHLAHYPGTRESGLDQEALWSDLTERKEDGRRAVLRREGEGKSTASSRTTTERNFFNGTGQHPLQDTRRPVEIAGAGHGGLSGRGARLEAGSVGGGGGAAFAAGSSTGNLAGGGLSPGDAGGAALLASAGASTFTGAGGAASSSMLGGGAGGPQHGVQQVDPDSLNYNPRYGVGREDILEEREERHQRSAELMPDLGASSDGYNLMMQSAGDWKPAREHAGGAGEQTELRPDVSSFPAFQTLNPTNARTEEDRQEDQDYAFHLLAEREKNDTSVPCTWFAQTEAQIGSILRTQFSGNARLGVLDDHDANAGNFRNFAEDSRYAKDVFLQTGNSIFKKSPSVGAVGFARSCTAFKNMVTQTPLNKRGVEENRYYGRYNGPTTDEMEYGDRFCIGSVQPVDRIFNPGLHAQDILLDEKIAILYSHTPTEVCDEDIAYDVNVGPVPANTNMFGHYTEDCLLHPGPNDSRLLEAGVRNPISRRMVLEIQDAPFPGTVGWDASRSGQSNLGEYSQQRPSLFGYAVEQALTNHYKLRDALRSVSAKVMQASNRVQKPCMQDRKIDICL